MNRSLDQPVSKKKIKGIFEPGADIGMSPRGVIIVEVFLDIDHGWSTS
ncbi:MAG: hypothetical protein QHH14_09420 [Clostridiales bacterium]|nr:hypothetical protein [Clostridiales bacterium]